MKIIGPFIGRLSPNSVRIWLHSIDGFPEAPLKVLLNGTDRPAIAMDHAKFRDYLIAIVDIDKLDRGRTYSFTVLSGDTPLAAGVPPEQLVFRTLPLKEEGDWSFVVMSCHNPLSYEKKHRGKGWRVWEAMPDILWGKNNANVRFGILGGDQVYNDEKETDLEKALTAEERRRELVDNYRDYWQPEVYQSVMRRLPAFMMWDDHDIYDGWGSFNVQEYSREGKVKWGEIFDSAKGAFNAFQASRNPAPLLEGDNFTCAFSHDGIGFLLLDLRTHRNKDEKRIWSQQQKESVYKWLETDAAKLDHLFIVSPVTLFHLSPELEEIIKGGLTGFAWFKAWFLGLFGRRPPPQPKDPKKDMNDDLIDSWGSSINQPAMLEFAERVYKWQNAAPASTGQPRSAIVLTGDIHLGGYTEFVSTRAEHERQPYLVQVISSPVAYEPQPALVGKAQSALLNPYAFKHEKAQWLTVQHRFLLPQRNFCVINVEQTEGKYRQFRVKFYREDFSEPQQVVIPPFPAPLERLQWDAL